MSDLSQISEDTTNKNEQQQEETLINDKINESVKTTEDESSDENDSEYEDVEEDDFDKINNVRVLTSIVNKNPFQTTTDEDELQIKIKSRRMNKKYQDDEHSEGCEDDNDNQNVPKISGDIKKSNTNKKLIDDDNNTQSPAYIPRKGKFYVHDDRTLNENDRSKQEISRNENRFYKDLDGKWQHDLYFQDEQISKSRQSMPRRDHDRFGHRNNYDREQLHLNDYMIRFQKGYNNNHYYNDYRRRVPHETNTKLYNTRINNFDIKDYDRSLSYNRNGYNKDINTYKEIQTAPRQQRHDYDPYQIDERTFHRRRNFTNSQYQQQDNDQRRLDKQSKDNNEYRNNGGKHQQQNRVFKRYELYDNKNNLPPRLQINNNYRNLIQKEQYQQNSISNLSTNVSSIERPKRYSNMRNTMTNPIQQQTSSSKIQHSNNVEQNDWPQAPPPPTSYLPQQITTPQIYYQQQTSRYVPINYSQTSICEQFQENK